MDFVNLVSIDGSCRNASIRAPATSRGVRPSRRAHSCTEYLSKTDITKTNRCRGGDNLLRALAVELPRDSKSTVLHDSGFQPLAAGAENTRRMALMIKQRLLQERSQPSKTQYALTVSPTVARKHCSASAWLPVNTKASKYKPRKSVMRSPQKSEHLAYPGVNCSGCLCRELYMVDFGRARPSLPLFQNDEPTPPMSTVTARRCAIWLLYSRLLPIELNCYFSQFQMLLIKLTVREAYRCELSDAS